MLENIRTELLSRLEDEASQKGADIVDVWVTKKANTPLVQVFVDSLASDKAPDKPISLDEVAAHTAWISELVDEMDLFSCAFDLEVSSPGIYRPLRRPEDFAAHIGENIKLKKKGKEGRLKYTGKLLSADATSLVLLSDKHEHPIALEDIETCTLQPEIKV